jgi:RNA polymerase II elongation factor ELL
MWRKTRQYLHGMGIPETDAAWDHVRNLPGSSETGSGPKRPAGVVSAERKKNLGSTSKAPIEAKDEGVRLSHTANVREEAIQAPRPTKTTTPKREEDDPSPRRLPGTSGPRHARETGPPQSQSQAQGPSKKVGPTDARAKHGDSSKPNGRPRPPTPIQPSSSHERDLEREEKPMHATKKHREDGSDLDREKITPAPAPKAKRFKDDASDLESLRDWDSVGKVNGKRKKLREDHEDRANGTGNTKRRKILDDDAPYKPGSGGGTSKARERDRDRESDRAHDKARSRAAPPVGKRPRDSDRGTPDASLVPRKPTVRERDRQRERETDRSLSPPRRVKRELSMSPALHTSHLREGSPLLRGSTKRTHSPPREVVKREGSPRSRVHSRRGDSPPAPRTSKRAPEPSTSQARVRGRDREASANGVPSTRRRRSPIYTSSEDEDEHHSAPVRRNPPSSATSSASSREPPRTQGYGSLPPPPPTAPYPKDREALQARYRTGYRSYFAVYTKLLEEREKIEDALGDNVGREGSVCSDRDVEMMDEEGLRDLADLYAAWTKELEGVRHAYSAESDRMDITT